MAVTPLRVEIVRVGKSYVGACDLIRPINRKVLRTIGELDEGSSQVILATFLRLLPREVSLRPFASA